MECLRSWQTFPTPLYVADYGLNDESGTIICSYPPNVNKPLIPIPYAEETMHGFEYEVASHMLLHGMDEEALKCVRAVRQRYDGERRNPWNELECGSNYARSLSSYALLLAYSGFHCDAYKMELSFSPLHHADGKWFFAMESGFGEVVFMKKCVQVKVLFGKIGIKTLLLDRPCTGNASFKSGEIKAKLVAGGMRFDTAIEINTGEVLCVWTK